MTQLSIIDRPSPNFDSRDGQIVDMLVLHYTGMKTPEAAIDRLCDPEAKVSGHYVVGADGKILRLVPEDQRAWHAGQSMWLARRNINQRSVGIELVNPGHEYGYRPFPKAQMDAVIALCTDILSRHAIPPRNVVGHSDVAPMRKEDPGELFDWNLLASYGIGLFPDAPLLPGEDQKFLSHFGYDTSSMPKAIMAFQRRFRPAGLTGEWDRECAGLLAALLKLV
jgi:N-acetylmuramoyl-L-alanine amidase